MMARFDTISLGQGQAKKAEAKMENGRTKGWWILLQNCHLCVSWLPRLEGLVEQLVEANHVDYRIWMTSMPSPQFPVSVLQNSVKMTMEPPSGLKANILQTYENFDNNTLNDSAKPDSFKKCLFAFAFFHAIAQDRRKFGAIGWNIPYAFTFEDFDVCRRQLKIFTDMYDEIPWQVLNILGAEVNYGGRVTDDKDVRLIKAILERFVQKGTLEVDFHFSESGTYRTIQPGSKEDYIKYIQTLPLNPKPEAFGLHENAEIITNQNKTRDILELVLSIQPRTSGGGGKSREEQIGDMAKSIQGKVPPMFDLDEVSAKYPTDYNESMNTVLAQECLKYNRLLKIMNTQLVNIQKALVGEVVMSEDLEKMGNSLYDNQVPLDWGAPKGFLSLKPLASWQNDLLDRIDFLSKWVESGTPVAFWISGFFFPQAFFTAALQNFARKHIIAIDELQFDFKIIDEYSLSEITEKPDDGVYTHGMFMEGARWNSTTHILDDSNPKQLYTEMPIIWFVPKRNRVAPTSAIYNCPIYKVLSRSGTLSTTGHSTNYCLMIELPSNKEHDDWVRAGVALFLALRY